MKNRLDPFRALIGVLETAKECDLLVAAADLAGLRFDSSVPSEQSGTHIERIRVLRPRVLDAYDALDDTERLAAAHAAITNLGPKAQPLAGRIEAALGSIGWTVQSGQLVADRPDVREIFFPAGSQWDAFVSIRDLCAEPKTDLTVIDPFADATLFPLVAARPAGVFTLRILCRKYATAVVAEAKAFCAQHAQTTIEVRTEHTFHDRFLILDGVACVHLGASINHAGSKAFMISRVEDQANQTALLASLGSAWAGGTVLL